jgi:hypothetical protein
LYKKVGNRSRASTVLPYTRVVNISPEEMTRRLAEADKRRLHLRRATLELKELGLKLFGRKNERETDGANRSERPNRGPAGNRSSI